MITTTTECDRCDKKITNQNSAQDEMRYGQGGIDRIKYSAAIDNSKGEVASADLCTVCKGQAEVIVKNFRFAMQQFVSGVAQDVAIDAKGVLREEETT